VKMRTDESWLASCLANHGCLFGYEDSYVSRAVKVRDAIGVNGTGHQNLAGKATRDGSKAKEESNLGHASLHELIAGTAILAEKGKQGGKMRAFAIVRVFLFSIPPSLFTKKRKMLSCFPCL
jgi:hypothetical protein